MSIIPQKYKYYQGSLIANPSQIVHLQGLSEQYLKIETIKPLLVVFVAETQSQHIENDFIFHKEITFDEFDKVNQKHQK